MVKDIKAEPTHRPKWYIYIPEEGHWEVPITHIRQDMVSARLARHFYLKWAGRKYLPPRSYLTYF